MKKRRHTPEQITRKLREADRLEASPLPPATRAWPVRRLERIAEGGDHPVRIVLLASRVGTARERRQWALQMTQNIFTSAAGLFPNPLRLPLLPARSQSARRGCSPRS